MQEGKLLRVNLDKNSSEIESISSDVMSKYFGGRGLGAYLYSKNPQKADEKENSLFVVPGYLNGTPFFSCSRSNFVSSSIHTGCLLSSSFGGFFGAYLRSNRFNAFELTGVSDKWIYVVIQDGKAEIKSAKELVGKNPYEVRDFFNNEFEDKNISVASIGEAGENLVKYSIVQFGNRAAGRSGSGWHFGYKKVKAVVVVMDELPIEIENNKTMQDILSEMRERKAQHEIENDIDKYCSAPYVEYANDVQAFPASNYRRNFVKKEEIEGFNMDDYESKTIRSEACWSCPLACTRILKSRYSDQGVKGPEYETLWSLGGSCDNFDLDVVVEANRLCDVYGLDTISTGSVLAWHKECVDKNIIDDEWITERMFELIELIGKREEIGNDLAEGVVKASENLGYGEEFTAHSKGLELPAWDPRTALGMSICYATGPTGGDHCKGWTVSGDVGDEEDRLTTKNKVDRAVAAQNDAAIQDAMGTCSFASFIYDSEIWARCVNVISGDEFTPDVIEALGERIFQLEHEINKALGWTLEDNVLPPRIVGYEVEVEGEKFKLSEEMLNEMLEQYYQKRGWK